MDPNRIDEAERAEQLRQKRLSRRKNRELAQADMADAGPGRLLAMAEAAGISSDQIAAVAQQVAGGSQTEHVNASKAEAATKKKIAASPKKKSSGGGGLGGLLDGLMGGANPMAMAEVASTAITGIVTALALVLALFLVATVFAMPRGYRIFWLLLIALTALFLGGFRLYQEWVNSASAEDSDSYRSMAQGMLTALTVVYTLVFVSIMFAIIWKIAVMTKRKTDLLDGKPPLDTHVKTGGSHHEGHARHHKKHKHSSAVDLEKRDVYM